MNSVEIFYCYAREDEYLRDKLEKHLGALKRSGQVSIWHDRSIQPGKEWASEIDTHLNTAHIILLLVSPDFMASDYCGLELQRALERHKLGEARVVPIMVRSVDTAQSPLGKLTTLPANGLPVTTWSNEDEAFLNVTQGIREVVAELIPEKSQQSSSKLAYQIQNLGLTKQKGALVVYADRMLRGRSVDLYEGSHLDGKLHSSASIVQRKIGKLDMFLAIFPSLDPNNYTVFTDWKYYARATVPANNVVEIDWREDKPLKRWWQIWK